MLTCSAAVSVCVSAPNTWPSDLAVRPDPEPPIAMALCDERQAILAWGRAEKGRTMEVVQSYRFARRGGCYNNAHEDAAKTVVALDATVADPKNYAGVLIEWAEREHRAWFWRCCGEHHVL